MHNFGEIIYWGLNQHCRAHPGGGCDIVNEVSQLVEVGKDTGTLATGVAGIVAYVRKNYGEDAATLVGALGAIGVIAYLAHRLSELQNVTVGRR